MKKLKLIWAILMGDAVMYRTGVPTHRQHIVDCVLGVQNEAESAL